MPFQQSRRRNSRRPVTAPQHNGPRVLRTVPMSDGPGHRRPTPLGELSLMLLLLLQLPLPASLRRVGRESQVMILISGKPFWMGALRATVLGIWVPRLHLVRGLLRRRQKSFPCRNLPRILTRTVLFKGPKPPWEQALVNEAVLAPSPSDYSFASVGDPRKATTAERPERRGGTPTIEEEAPDCESTEEVDASDFLLPVEKLTRSVTSTQREMGALHRFCEHVMSAPRGRLRGHRFCAGASAP